MSDHTRGPLRSVLAPAALSAVTALLVHRLPEPAVSGWRRSNFRGRQVSLSTGLAAAVGLAAGAALAGELSAPAVLAVSASALAGGYDDLVANSAEQRGDKGLAGHLGALKQGRVSGGVVKVAVIGAASVASAVLIDAADPETGLPRIALRAGVIAGTANLVNLLDLRPGRAGKVVTLLALLGTNGRGAGLGAAVLGTACACLRADLAERGMLGDLGANALGAGLGVRLASSPVRRQLLAAAALGALTLASERVSFSKVIESAAPLKWLDQLGRATNP